MANGFLRNATIAVPLRCLSNFWRSFQMPVINCVVKLELKWTKYCVLSVGGTEYSINEDVNVNIIFTVKYIKLYVPIETLSAKDNQKLIKLINNELKKSIYCNV